MQITIDLQPGDTVLQTLNKSYYDIGKKRFYFLKRWKMTYIAANREVFYFEGASPEDCFTQRRYWMLDHLDSSSGNTGAKIK